MRRHAETMIDVGAFVAVMVPLVAVGLVTAWATSGLRLGVELAAAALPKGA